MSKKYQVVFMGAGSSKPEAMDKQGMAAVVEFTSTESAVQVADAVETLISANPPEEDSKFQGTMVMQDGCKVAVITRNLNTARATAEKRAYWFLSQAIAMVAPENPAEIMSEYEIPTREEAIETAAQQA